MVVYRITIMALAAALRSKTGCRKSSLTAKRTLAGASEYPADSDTFTSVAAKTDGRQFCNSEQTLKKQLFPSAEEETSCYARNGRLRIAFVAAQLPLESKRSLFCRYKLLDFVMYKIALLCNYRSRAFVAAKVGISKSVFPAANVRFVASDKTFQCRSRNWLWN